MIPPRLVKWLAIALLVLGLCTATYYTGVYTTRAEAEERRREAVQEAVRQANAEAKVRQQEAEKRAEAFQQRLAASQAKLAEKDEALREYEGGDQPCFDAEALELFNSY